MEQRISDIHMHVVPRVDDGAVDLSMSIEMLQVAYEQGARNIYCTSHNVYDEDEIKRYKSQFMTLQMVSRSKFPELVLHMGCELLCAGEYVDDILYGLEIGVFLPLGNSKHVLTELYPDVTPAEAKKVVSTMVSAGWVPILAHTERYPTLFDDGTIKELISLGAKIQINLYSLEEDKDEARRKRARLLVQNGLVHFVGSDAHRSEHRPPKYDAGVNYIYNHCDKEYADEICFLNAERHLCFRP